MPRMGVVLKSTMTTWCTLYRPIPVQIQNGYELASCIQIAVQDIFGRELESPFFGRELCCYSAIVYLMMIYCDYVDI